MSHLDFMVKDHRAIYGKRLLKTVILVAPLPQGQELEGQTWRSFWEK